MRRLVMKAKKKTSGFVLRRDERGVAAIEMAFLTPVLLMMFIGAVDLAGVFSADKKITQATNTIADLITQAGSKIHKGDLDGIFNAARPILDPLPESKFGIRIIGLTPSAAGGNPQKSWEYTKGGMTCSVKNYLQKAKPLMSSGNDIIVAVGCIYARPLIRTFLTRKGLTLRSEMFLRPRQSDELKCTDC